MLLRFMLSSFNWPLHSLNVSHLMVLGSGQDMPPQNDKQEHSNNPTASGDSVWTGPARISSSQKTMDELELGTVVLADKQPSPTSGPDSHEQDVISEHPVYSPPLLPPGHNTKFHNNTLEKQPETTNYQQEHVDPPLEGRSLFIFGPNNRLRKKLNRLLNQP
jgi:hypothetical protein